ncbi:DUF6154 family protein [Pontibacillus litoralis]|uniref:Uncharacterized protein n=1 Tax=Pontibacillus litoralis JSM 072002 TaxID=1385512 RepID=A0A0A5HSX9_9BACI|nr:DUF6154 family protein [Pontibacillus litoralis]KGX86752.1 hypothetical protein N784_03920 [Pontibacillus litoralis JSM 072002]
MKFADNLFELYYKHFDTNDHLHLFTQSIIEQLDYEDLCKLIQECTKEELEQMMTTYVLHQLKQKEKKIVSLTHLNKQNDSHLLIYTSQGN